MPDSVRLLCVHGVGRHPPGGGWEQRWLSAIDASLPDAQVRFCYYDDLFADLNLTAWDMAEALVRLVGSALTTPFRGDEADRRWTAGMVVKWIESRSFREATRQRLATDIGTWQPTAVLAHSLGSLVAYDTFTEPATAASLDGRTFVTLGSQLGNPAVSGQFRGGRLDPLPGAARWFHLYNREDDVFTAPIRLRADNFEQVNTPFDIAGAADHAAHEYLAHPATDQRVWSKLRGRRRRPTRRKQQSILAQAMKRIEELGNGVLPKRGRG